MSAPHDFRPSPPPDRFGVPTVSFPTPNTDDIIVIEDVDISAPNFRPLEPGTPHERNSTALLVSQEPVKGNNSDKFVRRIYASNRGGQDAYNAALQYSGDDPTTGIYIRNYTLPRAGYAPLATGLPLTAVVGLTLTSGGSGYTSAPTVTISSGGGTGATAKAQVGKDGALVALMLTNGGTGYTSAPTVSITGNATATAAIQAQGAVLVSQEARPASEELVSLYLAVQRVYEVLPGPWLPFTRYDERLGPVQGKRRAVLNTSQAASLAATGKTTYEARNGSSVVSWEVVELWSDGTGEDGNPAYPVSESHAYDRERGDVRTLEQLVVIPTEGDGLKALLYSPGESDAVVEITYLPFDEFHMVKRVRDWLLPSADSEAHAIELIDFPRDREREAIGRASRLFIVTGDEESGCDKQGGVFIETEWERVNEIEIRRADLFYTLPGRIVTDYFEDERKGKVQRESQLIERPETTSGGDYLVAGAKVTEINYKDVNERVLRRIQDSFNLPGPARVSRKPNQHGVLTVTTKTLDFADITLNETAFGVLKDRMDAENRVYGEHTKIQLARPDGVALTGEIIEVEQVRDDRDTSVPIYTDSFRCDPDFAVPIIYTQDVLTGEGAYQSWKMPKKAAGTSPAGQYDGYSSTDYSPKRYPVGFRKKSTDDGKSIMEVDYCRLPLALVDSVDVGFQFPAIFNVNPSTTYTPNNFPGKYPPPWPIGAAKPNGYDFLAHRQNVQASQRVRTFTLGPTTLPLPKTYSVRSPGAASKYFPQITQNCIHPGFAIREVVEYSNEIDINLVESVPASTPSQYNPNDILVVSAKEERWAGEIYMQAIISVSESRPLSQFPSPHTYGYYTALQNFLVKGDVGITGSPSRRQIFAVTVGSGLETLTVHVEGIEETTNERKRVDLTAEPDGGTPVATVESWREITALLIDTPTSTDDVYVYAGANPDYATLHFTGFPSNGDTLTAGLTGGTPREYTFRTTLTDPDVPDEIRISSTLKQTIENVILALRAFDSSTYEGHNYSIGTTANDDVEAAGGDTSRDLIFSSKNPTVNDGSLYTLSVAGTYATASSWATGSGVGSPLAIIPATKSTAFNERVLANPTLLDDVAANDTTGDVNLPGVASIETEEILVPSGKYALITANANGRRPVEVYALYDETEVQLPSLTNGVLQKTWIGPVADGTVKLRFENPDIATARAVVASLEYRVTTAD